MNAVIDEDLPRSLAFTLSELGFLVFDIRDHGLRGHTDDEVFQFAQGKKAVLFSGDLGFGNILRYPLGKHHGICILRFPNEMPTDLINKHVNILLSKLLASDYKGNLVVLSPSLLRIRHPSKQI